MGEKISTSIVRKVSIKTKICQRLIKELYFYKREAVDNEEILAKMIKKRSDPYDIKKFKEVLGESYMMIPDSEFRMQKAFEDLRYILESSDSDLDSDSDFMFVARNLLQKNELNLLKRGKF